MRPIDFNAGNKWNFIYTFAITQSAGLFIAGSLSALIGAIYRYVLPKFGYETLYGYTVHQLSQRSFKGAVVCFTLSSFITFVILALTMKNTIFLLPSRDKAKD